MSEDAHDINFPKPPGLILGTCKCCELEHARLLDPDIGIVCEQCAHLLDHVGKTLRYFHEHAK